MSNELKINIPVGLDVDTSGAGNRVHEFANRVRREFHGIKQDSGAMESLFFSGKAGNDIFKKQLDKMQQSFQQFKRNVSKGYGAGKGRDELSSIFAPRSERMGLHAARMGSAMGRVGSSMRSRFQGMSGNVSAPFRAIGATAKMAGVELRGMAKTFSANTQSLQNFGKGIGKAAVSLTKFAMGGIKKLNTWLRGKKTSDGGSSGGGAGGLGMLLKFPAAKLLMAGAGIVGGAAASTYSEGMRNREEMMSARLGAATTLGMDYRSARVTDANKMGYRLSETAQMQATAARMGASIGSRQDQQALLRINRSLGEGGVDVTAGMMRRGDTRNIAQSEKRLSKIMERAMFLGIDRARVPELLNASNDYAERQIAMTPDAKDSAKHFASALVMMQRQGGKGFDVKYGAQTISQIDQAIKGSSGVKEAFTLRAFGFGRGTSYYDSLKMKEQGAFGYTTDKEGKKTFNIERIISQVGKEYRTKEDRALAFSRYTGVSIARSEKMLKMDWRGLSPEDKHKRLLEAKRKSEEDRMPMIQKEAYSAMRLFGKHVVRNAERFNRLAQAAENFYQIKDALNRIQELTMKGTVPLLGLIAKGAGITASVLEKKFGVGKGKDLSGADLISDLMSRSKKSGGMKREYVSRQIEGIAKSGKDGTISFMYKGKKQDIKVSSIEAKRFYSQKRQADVRHGARAVISRQEDIRLENAAGAQMDAQAAKMSQQVLDKAKTMERLRREATVAKMGDLRQQIVSGKKTKGMLGFVAKLHEYKAQKRGGTVQLPGSKTFMEITFADVQNFFKGLSLSHIDQSEKVKSQRPIKATPKKPATVASDPVENKAVNKKTGRR